MKVTKNQLKKIIAENLLLEFNVAWFMARKSSSLLLFLTSFLKDDENGMIESAKNIAEYYDSCEEMVEDIDEISESENLKSAMIAAGTPMIKSFDLKNKTVRPELFDMILNQNVVGCDEKVINKIKRLGYEFAQRLAAKEDFEDYKIVKDFKAKKFNFLNV